jgi:hypothetical protein
LKRHDERSGDPTSIIRQHRQCWLKQNRNPVADTTGREECKDEVRVLNRVPPFAGERNEQDKRRQGLVKGGDAGRQKRRIQTAE